MQLKKVPTQITTNRIKKQNQKKQKNRRQKIIKGHPKILRKRYKKLFMKVKNL